MYRLIAIFKFLIILVAVNNKEDSNSDTNPLIQFKSIPQTIPFIYNIKSNSMYKKIKKNNVLSEINKLKMKEGRNQNKRKIGKKKQKKFLSSYFIRNIFSPKKIRPIVKKINKDKKEQNVVLANKKGIWASTIDGICTGANIIKKIFKR